LVNRRKIPKATTQKRHAKIRAIQRYGFGLTDELLKEIVGKIHRGETRLIDKQSLRVSIHAVMVEGREIPVVYDKHRKTVVSLLPQEALEG
jgi:hypothetical protein